MFGIESDGLTPLRMGRRARTERRGPAANRAMRLALATAIFALAPAAAAQETKPPAAPPSVPAIEQRVDAFVAQLDARR